MPLMNPAPGFSPIFGQRINVDLGNLHFVRNLNSKTDKSNILSLISKLNKLLKRG